ncbi:Serine/threonine-protein phosphatase 6 regulatory ankyrin repeat subunit C [Echinococcus granulosus]|uniref:Serine/threonine-protein phosphatase 6 regulatory ankyrin repeat subunit C n=1 Tax=Echinococcus granulosus TaxID=6210 RepID=W6UQN4_ECHGR|nr:Serine/threonine-protein phosphatase 6 regulatory ankyrin repeat subunit C [Echinococcus granulosus]EUB63523.1 Serine/threonine-protein phosphatase 6 regulatory ankyrin repeat subunit C [Echinococcus granulosus]
MFGVGNSCLHADVQNNNIKSLLRNLAAGADVDCQNHQGDTPLMLACNSADTKCAKILISFGANTEKTNKFGRSALHIAASNGNLDMFTLLLTNGAKYDKHDCAGKTPFEVLLEKLSKSLIKAHFKKARHSQLGTLDRLTVLRQIIEALIYLKNLGIVHTTVSSYSIYLADRDHAKLANFEHALLWREWCEESGRRTVGPRLSEEEIVCLGAWLAPEVALLNRSLGLEVEIGTQMVPHRARSGSGGDSAYRSIFGSGGAGSDEYCVPTPATDTFGVARVMQELFEPRCAHRFYGSTLITSRGKSIGMLVGAEEKKLQFHLRPAIKKALRRESAERGEVEDLHIAIERAFWDLHDRQEPLQFRGQIGARSWCEGNVIHTDTTTISSLSEEALLYPGDRLSESEKENQSGVLHEEGRSITTYESAGPNYLKAFKHTMKSGGDSTNKAVLKKAQFSIMPGSSVGGDEVKSGEQRQLNFSSPILMRQLTNFEEKRVPKGQSTSLTKEQYIEMVAIPCSPLGPGRSRPLVPWRSPSAPVYLPHSPKTATSSMSSSSSPLMSNSELVSGRNSVVNGAGKWVKIVGGSHDRSSQHDNPRSNSRHFWSILSRRFQREYTSMKSKKAPIKPASHLTTPPMVPDCAVKKQRISDKTTSTSHTRALLSSSPFLKSDPEMPLREQHLSDVDTKYVKICQEAHNTTTSNVMRRVRGQIEGMCFQKTGEAAKVT